MALHLGVAHRCEVHLNPPRWHVCGGHPEVDPIDDPVYLKGVTVANEPQELKEFEYEHAGAVYTAQMTQEQADRLGAKPVGSGQARPKAAGEDSPKVTSKARRGTDNKAAQGDNVVTSQKASGEEK